MRWLIYLSLWQFCFHGDLNCEWSLFPLVHRAWRTRKPWGKNFMWTFFSLRFTYGHVQLSETGNILSLMAILYFVKKKKWFVGQGRLIRVTVLALFYESVKRRTKTKKIERKNNNNNKNNKLEKINKTTNPSKIDAICAQNVWKFIFMLDISIFRILRKFPIESLLNAWINSQMLSLCRLWIHNKH